jgi:hypothetical protein
LSPKQCELLGRRTHERQPGGDASLRETGILRQKPVTGVDRIAPVRRRDRDQLLPIEVCARADAAQRHRRVGLEHVQRTLVVLGMHGNGGDFEVGGGARNADGDLAAVGDEEFHWKLPVGSECNQTTFSTADEAVRISRSV